MSQVATSEDWTPRKRVVVKPSNVGSFWTSHKPRGFLVVSGILVTFYQQNWGEINKQVDGRYDWIRSNFHGFGSLVPNQKWGKKSFGTTPLCPWPWPTGNRGDVSKDRLLEHENYRWYRKTLSFLLGMKTIFHMTSFVTVKKVTNREFADNSGWCNNGIFGRVNHFEAPQRQSDRKNLGEFEPFWRRVNLTQNWKP